MILESLQEKWQRGLFWYFQCLFCFPKRTCCSLSETKPSVSFTLLLSCPCFVLLSWYFSPFGKMVLLLIPLFLILCWSGWSSRVVEGAPNQSEPIKKAGQEQQATTHINNFIGGFDSCLHWHCCNSKHWNTGDTERRICSIKKVISLARYGWAGSNLIVAQVAEPGL